MNLGRVRPSYIKRAARQFNERYSSKFTDDFNENKETLKEISSIKSKTIRNRIAGYITTIQGKQEIQ